MFEIGGTRHVLVVQAIASIPGHELEPTVSSLAAQHDRITRAPDILLLGF